MKSTFKPLCPEVGHGNLDPDLTKKITEYESKIFNTRAIPNESKVKVCNLKNGRVGRGEWSGGEEPCKTKWSGGKRQNLFKL